MPAAWAAHVAVRVLAGRVAVAELARLLGASDVLAAKVNLRVSPHSQAQYAQSISLVDAAQHDSSVAVARAEGRAMSVDQVLDRALAALETCSGDATSHAAAAKGLLSPRERQVLRLVAQGRSNRGIADALVISEFTAKFHLRSILHKLKARTRAEAVAVGAKLNLV
jgi:DNA-binding NarL/FixJ family response regulator